MAEERTLTLRENIEAAEKSGVLPERWKCFAEDLKAASALGLWDIKVELGYGPSDFTWGIKGRV